MPLVQWCQAGRLRNVAVTHLIEILAIVLGLIPAAAIRLAGYRPGPLRSRMMVP